LTIVVEALENKLLESGVTILKTTHLTSIKINEDKKIEAKGARKGEVFVADHLISGISSKQLAGILPEEHAMLAKHLLKINAATVAVVNLEFDGSVLDIEGFGLLYPSRESRKVFGVVFDSCTFAQGDRRSSKSTRLTVSSINKD
jgi:oxygen-dependent protoporphyrinogen oxidase